METISERRTGGRHRQGDEDTRNGIPVPRGNDGRDDRPAKRLPMRTGRYAAPVSGHDQSIEPPEGPFDRRQPLADVEDRVGQYPGDERAAAVDEYRERDGDHAEDSWVDERQDDAWGDESAEDGWDGQGSDEQWNGDSREHADGSDEQWNDSDEQWNDSDEQWNESDEPVAEDGPAEHWDGDEPGRADGPTVEFAEATPGPTPIGRAGTVAPPYAQPTRPSRSRRRRADPAGRRKFRQFAWAAAAMAALVGLGLAAVVAFPGLTRDTVTEVPQPMAAPTPMEVNFGERSVRIDGWTVEIGEPRAAGASDDVDLPADAERAVVLDVVLTNTGAEPRDTAGWTVKALVGSSPVALLPDGGAPSRTIRPGASLTFPVTVPMPKKGIANLQLEAAPIGGAPSLFVGKA